MKILALVEDLRINTSSGGICNSNFLSGLIKDGHQIDCYYDYAHSDDFPWLQSSLLKIKSISSNQPSLLFKTICKIPKGDAIVVRLTGFTLEQNEKIKAWQRSLKTALCENEYDLILFLGAGNSMLNYFSILGVKTTIPIMVNYHDPYPDNQYPAPYTGSNNRVAKIKTKKSNDIINKATIVSFPSMRLLEWMTQFHPALKYKSTVFPHVNGLLQDLPEIEEDIEVTLNENRFNIVHAGSLLGSRNPEFLIRAFKKFIDGDEERRQKAILNIIGHIDRKNKVTEIDLNQYETNIRLIRKRVSYKKSKEIFAKADVLLIIEAVGEDSPFMPGKLTDYIEAEKNIMALTPKKSEISRLFGDKYPYITETDNEDGIYLILVTLWELWKSKQKVIDVPPALKHYVSWENQNALLTALFAENK
ncbi:MULTISPECIES: hypothetical protein [Flavobacterium]|uniref:hypothetical protein n=1 Tax=Flavobacterium TaxID=237 RepID=UPI001FCB6EB1|nr:MULTISPECIES: hypothetical protein [Flavobacterium]UOK43789.1 hypothetical protein LZF87_06615 [Flavobacterium enshiense]